jgi:hypothetical protein
MTCSICNQTFQGFGNDARWLGDDARCCDDCNTKVIQFIFYHHNLYNS